LRDPAVDAPAVAAIAPDPELERRVTELLRRMTLEEKIGQITQYPAVGANTGPGAAPIDLEAEIRAGRVGSLLNASGVVNTRRYQALALQSRLRIPLLFGQDIVHGYATAFPIPLAQAASWDVPAIEAAERIAAREASAAGLHWTFAPMVDIARDPRWGRVMEGAGEDTLLGSRIAAARVRGFQGTGLAQPDTLMACVKHFAAYGEVLGGREYDSVDVGERSLQEVYLPPYRAAIEAGAGTVMNAFNTVNGMPASAHTGLVQRTLKGDWNFDGFVVSDWNSIGELVYHGLARDLADAARRAILAGNDMDMKSAAYRRHLAALVASGAVPIARVDDAVRRVLRRKFQLGLFEDPARHTDEAREARELNRPENRAAARALAAESIVLLQNRDQVLPLRRDLGTVAFIGPMVKLGHENRGGWSVGIPAPGTPGAWDAPTISQWDGLREALPASTRLIYARGADAEGQDRSGFAEALEVARQADVVVLSVGEPWSQSGEARSRSSLRLTGVQEDLVRAVAATGRPVVLLVNTGRPLVFPWAAEHLSTILVSWWLGSEAGHAIADVLTGRVNPSGHLPMSFPRSEGQVPVFYNHLSSGRPLEEPHDDGYVNGYIDLPTTPQYAFGHGLSYTRFNYEDLSVDTHRLGSRGDVRLAFTLRNAGPRAGDEVVQFYVRQRGASVARPVLELKDFQRVHLEAGQATYVVFTLSRAMMNHLDADLAWGAEEGSLELMVGAASDDIRLRELVELVH
jgi:beta-glucosidase